jgi:hypothetical protein
MNRTTLSKIRNVEKKGREEVRRNSTGRKESAIPNVVFAKENGDTKVKPTEEQ